jgi:hypothetical protein
VFVLVFIVVPLILVVVMDVVCLGAVFRSPLIPVVVMDLFIFGAVRWSPLILVVVPVSIIIPVAPLLIIVVVVEFFVSLSTSALFGR